jgi:hypothetical protein
VNWTKIIVEGVIWTLFVGFAGGSCLAFLYGISKEPPGSRARPGQPGRAEAAGGVLALGRAVSAEVNAYHQSLDALLGGEAGRAVTSNPALAKRYRTLRGEDTRAARWLLEDILRRASEIERQGDRYSSPRVNGAGESLTPEEELHRMEVKLRDIRFRYAALQRELDDIIAEALKSGR